MTAINDGYNKGTIDELNSYIDNNSVGGGVKLDRKEIERLFEETEYYNEGQEGAAKLGDQISKLEQKIGELQKEIKDLQQEIQDADLKVKKQTDELVELTCKILKEEGKNQDAIKEAAEKAAEEAKEKYNEAMKRGEQPDFEAIYQDCFDKAIMGAGFNTSILKNLAAQQANVQNNYETVIGEISRFMQDANALQTKLDNTNATINLLSRTKANMSQTLEGAYKNVDTDGKEPIYSGAKAELANQILEKYQSRNQTETVADTGNGGKPSKAAEDKMNEYLKLKGDAKYTSGDKYSAQQNPELMSLRNLVADGMLDELKNTGMSTNQIMEFVSTNWNVGISKQEDGTWKIPKGHSSDAWVKEDAFNKLADLVNSGTKKVTADGVNQNQMLEMKDAVEKDGILTQMYAAGFTFKEAMCVLIKAFPDAGITYDVEKQDKRNYGKVADSQASGTLFKTMGEQILNYWNVGSTTPEIKDPDSPSSPPTRFDPITFQKGDTTYTFIEDRDGDAKFDYTDGKNNELLGSKNGIQELINYDVNGDGKIDANDIMKDKDGNDVIMTQVDGTQRKMTALDALTLMSNKQTESVANSKDVDGYKFGDDYKGKGEYTNSVDFTVTYTSAANLGITSIDLSQLQKGNGQGETLGDSTRTYDGTQEEYEDINGSSVINQFNISFGNETVTAKETLNTESNLETFYKQIADTQETGNGANSFRIYSRLDEQAVNDAFADYSNNITYKDENGNEVTVQAQALKDQLSAIKEDLAEKKAQADADNAKGPEVVDVNVNAIIEELEQSCDDERDLVPDSGDNDIETDNKTEEEKPTTTPEPNEDDKKKDLDDNPNPNAAIK